MSSEISDKKLDKFYLLCSEFGLGKAEIKRLEYYLKDNNLKELVADTSVGIMEDKLSQPDRRQFRKNGNLILALASYIEGHQPMFWSDAIIVAKGVVKATLAKE